MDDDPAAAVAIAVWRHRFLVCKMMEEVAFPQGQAFKSYDREIVANMDEKDPKEPENKQAAYLSMGIALGISLGAAFGVIMDNLALGIGMGLAIGVGLGSALGAKNK